MALDQLLFYWEQLAAAANKSGAGGQKAEGHKTKTVEGC